MQVYLITNKINGKKYVGQTVRQTKDRLKYHLWQDSCPALHRALLKYGVDNFSITTLVICSSKEEMDSLEALYVKTLNTKVPNGYNIADGGHSAGAHKCSEETKEKIRKARVGMRFSAEHRKNLSISHKGKGLGNTLRKGLAPVNKGKTGLYKHSEQAKKSIAKAVRLRYRTQKTA